MSYTALNAGVAYVTGEPWGFQDADLTRTNLADHETRLLTADPATATTDKVNDGFGGYWLRTKITEEITLSTSGATTDSTADLLPVNSIIEAVTARITTTIVTATNWKLGDATISGRFTAANATLTAGTTSVGDVHIDQAGTSGPRQTAAAKLRVTCTGTPSAGKIRVVVYYRQFVAPTS